MGHSGSAGSASSAPATWGLIPMNEHAPLMLAADTTSGSVGAGTVPSDAGTGTVPDDSGGGVPTGRGAEGVGAGTDDVAPGGIGDANADAPGDPGVADGS